MHWFGNFIVGARAVILKGIEPRWILEAVSEEQITIVWLLVRASRGHFSSEYFTPVDLVGLYWHLVDLIWIFLFPLFYLIG